MDIRFWLFGSPRIEIGGKQVAVTTRKAVALLAYLSVRRTAQAREPLAAIFWGDLPQDRALANLRQTLLTARGYLPPDFFAVSRTHLGISPVHDLWVDVNHFHDRVNDRQAGVDRLVEACSLYNGEFMAGFNLPDSPDFDAWQDRQRDALSNQYRKALLDIIAFYRKRPGMDNALQYAQKLVGLDPLDEAGHRLLMTLYIENGQAIAALNQYHICVENLETELGIGPEEEIVHLYRQILHRRAFAPHQPATVAGELAALKPVGLYPPLPEIVIGREPDVAGLRAMLEANLQNRERSAITIQGWPGVGKSAVLGLLANDADIHAMFPDGILSIALGEYGDAAGSLYKWAENLGLAEIQIERSLEQLTDWLRGRLRHRRILMLVDDIYRSELADYFRLGGDRCATVFTTRFNDVARDISGAASAIYKLSILDQESALNLLCKLAPDVVAAHPQEAATLVRDLEGLPLALQVAGRLLQSEYELGWGVKDLFDSLGDGMALMKTNAPADRFDSPNNTLPTVSELLRQSTSRLDEVNKLRFASLGGFAPKPATFGMDALAAIWGVSNPKETIRLLVNRGLMEPAGEGRFQVHALLIAFARSMFTAS